MDIASFPVSDPPFILATLFLSSAALTVLSCLFAQPLGQLLGVMDSPSGSDGHKRHLAPTPAVGGLIFAIVGCLAFIAALPVSLPAEGNAQFTRIVSLGAIAAGMVVGFFDDRKHIPATIRLLTSLAILTTLLLLVPRFQIQRLDFASINLSLETGWFALPLTLLCLVALKNAINMADGRNGLILGMSIIWNVFFLFHALPQMTATLVGVLGILSALFIFNMRGKLFMGDCGSYGLATYFGILTLALHSNAYGSVRSAEAVLLFLIPVLDTGRLVIVRMTSGRSPFAPDQQHLHHLLDQTMGWPRGWAVYMALVGIPIALYQVLPKNGVPMILAATAAYALVVFYCLRTRRQDMDELERARDDNSQLDQAAVVDAEQITA